MKASWRLWLLAALSWAIFVITVVLSLSFIQSEHVDHRYDIVFLVGGLLLPAAPVFFTRVLIREIRKNADKKKAARQAEIESRLKEMAGYDERRLLEVLAEFGYQDQFSDLIKATEDGRLRWMMEEVHGDGFTKILYKNYTPEEIGSGSRRTLLLEVWMKEVAGTYSLNFRCDTAFGETISYHYQQSAESGDKRVKELFDCAMQKSGKPQ
ncbi:MAG: hypothetical protein G01um10143_221 [Parcubacteria group bacterium Gr01-1014_3]|nr:MAG: hypothetical protein G01um10143_221 [Parcubacteria group bacterium Gr01-1014_3]